MTKAAHVDLMSWAAGVLDVAGRFTFREREGYPYAATVQVSCSRGTGALLTEATGVGKWRKDTWRVPAKQQEEFLSRMIPYLRIQYKAASRVYRWRLTAPRRRVNWRVSGAVDKYRRSLVDSAEKTLTGG